jgi:proteic killer suppression protein
MQVSFATRGMQKACSSDAGMRKKWGVQMARKLQQRLMELTAAETLADFGSLPNARCHELKGDRGGQLSADLVHPYRLIIEPDHRPVPRKQDGGLDWVQVTKIVVIEVCDTH